MSQIDRTHDDLDDVAHLLRDEFGEVTGMELDRAKRLARSRALSPRSANKGVRMRPARKTLALILAVGVAAAGSGSAFVIAKGPGTGHGKGHGGYPPPPGCKHTPGCPR